MRLHGLGAPPLIPQQVLPVSFGLLLRLSVQVLHARYVPVHARRFGIARRVALGDQPSDVVVAGFGCAPGEDQEEEQTTGPSHAALPAAGPRA